MRSFGVVSVWAFAFLFSLTAAGTLFADTLVLKDGTTYRNVKSVNRGDRLFIVFSNGRTRGFPRSAVKSLALKKVNWRRAISTEHVRKLVDEALGKRVDREVKKVLAERKQDEERRARADENKRRIRESRLNAALAGRTSALWRSALVPGWGQLYGGREGRAYIFASTAGLSLLYFLNRRTKFMAAQREYDDSALPVGLLGIVRIGGPANLLYFQERRSSLRRAESETNRALLLMAGVWSLNLWEVYANSPINVTMAPGNSRSIFIEPSFQLRISLPF